MTLSKITLYERTRWAIEQKQGLVIDDTGAVWTGRTRDDARAIINRLSMSSARPIRVTVTVWVDESSTQSKP
jgi:pyrimidine operon attenuation protein/uracil phosphoribosyltransferase